MSQGICNTCRKYKKLHGNGSCGGCQAQKYGGDFAEWLFDFVAKKIKLFINRKK
ncbi:MAG: hypothetical protein HHJ15_16955 [Rhodoferax sp.]|nr:hypothetical protein [Rhodoferax sp.]NMM21614.1 hypothetical protein [Rhodoferax sp.]